jgi:hypothetical protein
MEGVMSINDIKTPISSAWAPGQRIRRDCGTYEAVNLAEIDYDSGLVQRALLRAKTQRPSLLGAFLPAYLLVVALSVVAYLVWR